MLLLQEETPVKGPSEKKAKVESQPTCAAKGSTTIIVKNISWGTDANGLKKFLKSCGNIVDVRIGESSTFA